MTKVTFGNGLMAIVATDDHTRAIRKIKGAYGNDFAPFRAKEATAEDVEWFTSMGGEVVPA